MDVQFAMTFVPPEKNMVSISKHNNFLGQSSRSTPPKFHLAPEKFPSQ